MITRGYQSSYFTFDVLGELGHLEPLVISGDGLGTVPCPYHLAQVIVSLHDLNRKCALTALHS